jgi:hypothetical protein
MAHLNPTTAQTAIQSNLQAALGSSNWDWVIGDPLAPDGPTVKPRQVSVWWDGIPSITPPMELRAIEHRFRVLLIAPKADEREAIPTLIAAWQSIYTAWLDRSALYLTPTALAYWSAVERTRPTDLNGTPFPALQLTLTVIDKTPDTFT